MIIPVDWRNQAEHIGVLSLATYLVTGFLALGHRPVIVVDTFSGDKVVRFIAELQALRSELDVRLFALVPNASVLGARVESRPDGEFKDTFVWQHHRISRLRSTSASSSRRPPPSRRRLATAWKPWPRSTAFDASASGSP